MRPGASALLSFYNSDTCSFNTTICCVDQTVDIVCGKCKNTAMFYRVSSKIIRRHGEGGKFWCYECKAEHNYTCTDLHEYFCIWGIPIFSHGIVSSEIHCQGCDKVYSGEVLRGMTDGQLTHVRALAGEWLKNKSIEDVTKLLVDWRIPDNQIKRLLGLAVGNTTRKCHSCGFSFTPDKEQCLACQKPLTPPEPYASEVWDMSSVVTWTRKP